MIDAYDLEPSAEDLKIWMLKCFGPIESLLARPASPFVFPAAPAAVATGALRLSLPLPSALSRQHRVLRYFVGELGNQAGALGIDGLNLHHRILQTFRREKTVLRGLGKCLKFFGIQT